SAMIPPPPRAALFPYTTLFRSRQAIGLVSQSGALGFALGQAIEHGVSFSHVLTAGNSADVDVADYVSYLAEDEGCTAIACLFERSEEHTSELQSRENLVCRLLL